jgi:hypothetical protein
MPSVIDHDGPMRPQPTDCRPEQNFLVALARWRVLGGERPSLPDIPDAAGAVLLEASRHKLTYEVASFILEAGIKGNPLLGICEDLLAASRRRHAVIRDVALELQAALRSEGVPSLMRKGIVYQHLAYRRPGIRLFNDMDMFVPPDHVNSVRAVFERLGFFHGAYAAGTRELQRWGRRETALYRLFPDHMPRFARPHDDPFVRMVFVDIATEMAWHGSPYTENLRGLLGGELRSPSTIAGMETMRLAANFLDCILHLYREASFETHIRARHDVNVRKFQDTLALWAMCGTSDIEDVRTIIADHKVALPVAWVTQHLDGLFATQVSASLGLEGHLSDQELSTWFSDNGKAGQWRGTMRQRLFARERLTLFEPALV